MGAKMAKSKRELEIALLKIQAILLEADAMIYVTEYSGDIKLENIDDSEFSIDFKNYGD
jgi:hypothetical protein